MWFHPSEKLCLATRIFILTIKQKSQLSMWLVLGTCIDMITVCRKVLLCGIEDLKEGSKEQKSAKLQDMDCSLYVLI